MEYGNPQQQSPHPSRPYRCRKRRERQGQGHSGRFAPLTFPPFFRHFLIAGDDGDSSFQRRDVLGLELIQPTGAVFQYPESLRATYWGWHIYSSKASQGDIFQSLCLLGVLMGIQRHSV